MFSIEMLPASYGDALWIEYGEPRNPRIIVVDCGFRTSYRTLIQRLEKLEPERLELLVLTHVDEDHIKGAVPLLADPRLRVAKPRDIWFNGWHHLVQPTADKLGAMQGEFLSSLIRDNGFSWNSNPWRGAAVVIADDSRLPSGQLAGGLSWTLLSPTVDKLVSMGRRWNAELAEHTDLEPGDHEGFLRLFGERRDVQPDRLGERPDVEALATKDFKEDTAEPNGSSIALLLEYEGRSVLLAGDAHPSVLAASLRRLAQEREVGRIAVDALKVSHHGSPKSTSASFLDTLDCRTFLFSSSGAKWGYPSAETIARILVRRQGDTRLVFNYENDTTSVWSDPSLQREYSYKPIYPQGKRSISVLA